MRLRHWGVIALSILGAVSLGQFLRDVATVSFWRSGTVTEGRFRGLSIGGSSLQVFRVTSDNENSLKLSGYNKDGGAVCYVGYAESRCGPIGEADQYYLVRSGWYEEWVTVNVVDDQIASIEYRRQFIYLDL